MLGRFLPLVPPVAGSAEISTRHKRKCLPTCRLRKPRQRRLPPRAIGGILTARQTLGPFCSAGGDDVIPISVQLYTVRDLAAKDFPGTLKQVAAIGYKSVELAGYGNLKSAAEAKKALDDAGLSVAGAHAPIEVLEKDVEKVMDESELLGNKLIICPWMPEGRRKDAEGWKSAAKSLNQVGRACHERGI